MPASRAIARHRELRVRVAGEQSGAEVQQPAAALVDV